MNEHPDLPEDAPEPTGAAPVPGGSPTADLSALERLRERVELAARELKRLRQENQALAGRIQALEARTSGHTDQTLLAVDDPPEALEQRIRRFIQAIDRYLDEANPAESEG